jgi:hypothetical protein
MWVTLFYCQKVHTISTVSHLIVLSKGAMYQCFLLGRYMPYCTEMLSTLVTKSVRHKKNCREYISYTGMTHFTNLHYNETY